ncbi:MAG: hypothetical protein ABEJ31_01385 [Haloarculaceae archaeon]
MSDAEPTEESTRIDGNVGDSPAAALSGTRLTAVASGGAALLGVALLGTALVGTTLSALTVGAGVLLAAGLYALGSDDLGTLFVAGIVVTVASTLLSLSVSVGVSVQGETAAVGQLAAAAVVLLVLGSFAAVLTAVPAGEAAVLARSFPRFVGMLVPVTVAQFATVAIAARDSVLVFLARLVVDSPGPLLSVARTLLAPTGPAALLTLLVELLVVAYLVFRVVAALPIARLFPPRRRPSVATHVDEVAGRLARLTVYATAASTVLYITALAAGLASPGALGGLVGPAFAPAVGWLLTATALRVTLVLIAGTLVALLLGERLRRFARRRTNLALVRELTPAVGAVATALVAALVVGRLVTPADVLTAVPPGLHPTATRVLDSGVVPAAMVVAFGSLILVGALFVLLTILAGSPALSERALGPLLAGAAVFGLALAYLLLGGAPALAFVAAALAMVAWDAGEFATGLGEELPADAASLRAEFVHLGGALAVAVAAVLGALALAVLVERGLAGPANGDAALAAGAVVVAFGTVLVLLSSLRE